MSLNNQLKIAPYDTSHSILFYMYMENVMGA